MSVTIHLPKAAMENLTELDGKTATSKIVDALELAVEMQRFQRAQSRQSVARQGVMLAIQDFMQNHRRQRPVEHLPAAMPQQPSLPLSAAQPSRPATETAEAQTSDPSL